MGDLGQTKFIAEHDKDELLADALQALKDIVGATENGEPYSLAEMAVECDGGPGFVTDILGRAYDLGIRLNGED